VAAAAGAQRAESLPPPPCLLHRSLPATCTTHSPSFAIPFGLAAALATASAQNPPHHADVDAERRRRRRPPRLPPGWRHDRGARRSAGAGAAGAGGAVLAPSMLAWLWIGAASVEAPAVAAACAFDAGRLSPSHVRGHVPGGQLASPPMTHPFAIGGARTVAYGWGCSRAGSVDAGWGGSPATARCYCQTEGIGTTEGRELGK